MKAHWSNWYNEDSIKSLAEKGVKRVRIPIGDWTINQYSHYKGCMDGAADEIRKMLDICAKYNIGVILNVHAVRGSQNGKDSSGRARKV